MIPVMQDIYAPPYGNCFAASVASVLEIDDLERVPSYFGFARWWTHGWERWFDLVGVEWQWLFPTRKDGSLITNPAQLGIHVKVEMFAPVVEGLGIDYWIACGEGPRGCEHAVVMDAEANLAHDPHPRGRGLIKYRTGLVLYPT